MDTISIISIIFGIISISFGLYSIITQYRTKTYLKIKTFNDFSNISMLIFNAQKCIEHLNDSQIESALLYIGKVEGMGQTIYQRTAGDIQFYNNFNKDKLDKWLEAQKIDQNRYNILKNYLK